jgi:carbonic anhydrase
MPCSARPHPLVSIASPVRQAVLCLLAALCVGVGGARAEEVHAPAASLAAPGTENPATGPLAAPVDDGTPRLGVIQGIALPFKPLRPSTKPPVPVSAEAADTPVIAEGKDRKAGLLMRGASTSSEVDAHAVTLQAPVPTSRAQHPPAGKADAAQAIAAQVIAPRAAVAAGATDAASLHQAQAEKAPAARADAAAGAAARAAASPHEAVPAGSTTSSKPDEPATRPAGPVTLPVASTFRPIFAAGRHRSSMQPGIGPAPGSQAAEASAAAATASGTTAPAAAQAPVARAGGADAVVEAPVAAAPEGVTTAGGDPLERLRQRLSQTFGSRDMGGATVRVSSKGGAAAPVTAGPARSAIDDARAVSGPAPSARPVDRRAAASATSRLALLDTTSSHATAGGASRSSGSDETAGPAKSPTLSDVSKIFNPVSGICGSGQRQSPIDLRDTFKVDLDPVAFHYRPTPFAVVDNGRTVQAQVAAGNSIEVNGRKYELTRVEFRHPAEERVDGKTYALGAHLIHRDSEGRQAVVAVVMEEGAPGPASSPVVQTVWNNLPLERGEAEQARAPLDLEQLLPSTRGYFTYMGSMTSPPCEEGVLWMVMKTPVPVDTAQVDLFARLYPMNARSVQAANGRMVKESN